MSSVVTPAIRVLRAHAVSFTEHPYRYEPRGGTQVSSRELGVDEHCVVKTLVMQDEAKRPLIVLMHGDCEISLNKLARVLGVKSVETCAIDEAEKNSGYFVGGTSPFGFRKKVPIYAESSIFSLAWIIINGGARGFFVKIDPQVLHTVLGVQDVEAKQ